MLQAGDAIPEFQLTSTEGGEVSSKSLRGRRYVLYFYPKDDTPGCTVEACNFRDLLPHFGDIGTPVYGVSPDDIDAHQKFIAKHALNFPLLADPERKLIEAVGAWVEKSMYGKKYMGVQRSTFVVGPDGRVEKVWPKVTPDGHAQEVLDYLKSSSASGNAPQAAPAGETAPPKRPGRPAEADSRKKPAGVQKAGKPDTKPAAGKKTARK